MAQTVNRPGGSRSDPSGGAWITGGTMFAGTLMFVGGVLAILTGIAGISDDDVYGRVGNYVYEFDVSAWGWTHLILGIVLVLTGLGILSGVAWARTLGVVIASLHLIANFMWLPYSPVWAIVAVAIDGFVIWALCGSMRTAGPRT
ncbi:hypothetical protein [Streptomyces sp. SCSIO ZS0520]|uniref:Putative integral membrane protein n=1 Tax=Streptomyces albus (strain ATCC 21838 / DSM 41398 / FERM P-419 / JCM 4703 / NBRC 107858) TaxID=1081613 RepID=A0A0B5EXZ8_STRA4|nr:hypothetical protein [Streptomyces sp. SCSIO ZS0520]AJE87673.1 putative integral membrane protein [Streptomyces albus]